MYFLLYHIRRNKQPVNAQHLTPAKDRQPNIPDNVIQAKP